MGTRGIPANYGGFETFAEELSTRLVSHGHHVTVYCRSNNVKYRGKQYKNVNLVVLPTISHKYLDTVVHTFISTLHGLFGSYDAILVCNSVNALFCLLPRVTGAKVLLNVDGLEWQRAKWNKMGQWVYRISEWLATFLPNQIVTDSLFVQRYYLSKFHKESTFIPYGAPVQRLETKDILEKYNLEPNDYVLYVSRLEPENNAHLVVKAFEKVKTNKKLVIVGDAPYSSDYINDLKKTKDSRIIFTGYVFGQAYKEFQSNAYFYVQATEVGGTHPALLEGMGFGNCVLANDVPEHREVVQDAGVYFQTKPQNNIHEQMQRLLDRPDLVDQYRARACERIRQEYSWEKIVNDYEQLFFQMTKKKCNKGSMTC